MKTFLLAFSTALLFTATSFASGEITFKKLKNNVTKIEVRSRLILSTKDHDLTLTQLKAINSSLNNYLNLTHDYKDKSGERFQLTFKVVAVEDTDITTNFLSDNYLDIATEGRDFASPDGIRFMNYDEALNQADVIIRVGNKATISLGAIDPYSTTISHETLHLFGLDDRYHDLVLANGSALSVEDENFDRDIMSSSKEAFSPLHIKSFVNLVKDARNQGLSQFYLSEVTNYNVGHISEKPMYLMQLKDQHSSPPP